MILKHSLLSLSDEINPFDYIKKHRERFEGFNRKIEDLFNNFDFENEIQEINYTVLIPKYGNEFKVFIEETVYYKSVKQVLKDNYPEFVYNGGTERIYERIKRSR